MKIATPLTSLLKDKSESIDWTEECDLSFVTLRGALIQTLVLTIMNS